MRRHEAVKRELDLADIQGNIVRPYGRYGFPMTRHLFFNIGDPKAGRKFIERVRHKVTTAERWRKIDDTSNLNAPLRPLVAMNIGLSYLGLAALALPTRTLAYMPDEFIDGMAKRASILGDIGPSDPENWDEIWREARKARNRQVHVWVSLHAQCGTDGKPVGELATLTEWLKQAANEADGVTLLGGNKNPDPHYQDSAALMRKTDTGQWVATPKEHFHFTDGISDPTFAGQYEPAEEAEAAAGGGKLLPKNQGWAPLATGEFILGHVSEAQELPPSPMPWSFMRNGTFMAYRKLHQNVGSFDRYADEQAALFQRVTGEPSPIAAKETVLAKMVGRWRNGVPLALKSTWAEAEQFDVEWADIPKIQAKIAPQTKENLARLVQYETLLTDFRYGDDREGTKCPIAAHTRRANPRDALGPVFDPLSSLDTTLANRRRIMRRGLPYGDSTIREDDGEHGVIFIALCSSLFRQFEFVQQQWIQYGAVFNAGNDTDPLVGLRREGAKFVIAGDAAKGGTPFICANIPQFVETRGGEYFFLPSLTALREIAQGTVDPT
jgi:Dyp-type peroxidase family